RPVFAPVKPEQAHAPPLKLPSPIHVFDVDLFHAEPITTPRAMIKRYLAFPCVRYLATVTESRPRRLQHRARDACRWRGNRRVRSRLSHPAYERTIQDRPQQWRDCTQRSSRADVVG